MAPPGSYAPASWSWITGLRKRLRWMNHVNLVRVASEVDDIEGHQHVDVVSQHGRHKLSVVNRDTLYGMVDDEAVP